MLFNLRKCNCLHTGHENLNVNYEMGGKVPGPTITKKDLK